jgi:hypothetical protein
MSVHTPPHAVRPPGQASEQLPCEQTLGLAHALPHAPQWSRLRSGSTHSPPHFIRPGGQTQVACEQVVLPWQTVPQAPQLAPSLRLSTQAPPQNSNPWGHPRAGPAASSPVITAIASVPPPPGSASDL